MKNKIKFIIVLFLVLSTIFCINMSRSRYLQETDVRSNLDVAIPQIVLEGASSPIDEMLPGDSRSYDFYIKNFDSTQTNEVLMQYYITVELATENFPLTYKIYSVEGGVETELSQTAEGFGPITLNYGTQESKQYRIEFNWDANNNSESYANKSNDFQLKVNAVQVM